MVYIKFHKLSYDLKLISVVYKRYICVLLEILKLNIFKNTFFSLHTICTE